jgi:hypothetical protein
MRPAAYAAHFYDTWFVGHRSVANRPHAGPAPKARLTRFHPLSGDTAPRYARGADSFVFSLFSPCFTKMIEIPYWAVCWRIHLGDRPPRAKRAARDRAERGKAFQVCRVTFPSLATPWGAPPPWLGDPQRVPPAATRTYTTCLRHAVT